LTRCSTIDLPFADAWDYARGNSGTSQTTPEDYREEFRRAAFEAQAVLFEDALIATKFHPKAAAAAGFRLLLEHFKGL